MHASDTNGPLVLMTGISVQSCWLVESCKLLLGLLYQTPVFGLLTTVHALQVALPSLGHPKALPMKQAILGCLQVQPQKRLTAKEVQVALHQMMQERAWI